MQYHIQLDAPMLEGAEYAILAGDPGRIEAIAQHLELVPVRCLDIPVNKRAGHGENRTPCPELQRISHGLPIPSKGAPEKGALIKIKYSTTPAQAQVRTRGEGGKNGCDKISEKI